jgi:hypothetical protein
MVPRRNLKERIATRPESGRTTIAALNQVRRPGEAEASEGYLRDRLGEELHRIADFWLVAQSAFGDVAYVVGATVGAESQGKKHGIVELIRKADQSIAVNAFEIDAVTQRRIGDEIRGELSEHSNSAIDTITLAWLARLLNPENGAKEAGPAAYQEIAAGGRMIYRLSRLV